MRRGLVIGKFMPLHQGHVALIKFAAAQCDELIVSVSFTPEDPIPGPLRFSWIQEEFRNIPDIKPYLSLDDFDDDTLPLKERIPSWGIFLKSRFPTIDVVFSSEQYGALLAGVLGAVHISFDPERKKFPVSGSLIRKSPFRYWAFIAMPARPHFVKKICFYGPESTGKSTLARHMAIVYQTEFVPEVSRELIDSNKFSVVDIIKIGTAQTERVLEKTKTANKLLFCDTDLITTQIYCHHYLREIPPILFELEKRVVYDHYFLFDADVPWVADGLRDLGERRGEMFQVFKSELDKRGLKYELIRGDYASREALVQRFLNPYFALFFFPRMVVRKVSIQPRSWSVTKHVLPSLPPKVRLLTFFPFKITSRSSFPCGERMAIVPLS
jgi:HTH-type transcriptional repressor of NAD biosynthesis genes